MNEYQIDTIPLAGVQAQMEEADIIQLLAYGDVHDDARWGAGEMARKYIDERGLPYKQVCIIIGNLTDYSPVSVKRFLASARYYHEHPEFLDYKMTLRYSIMAHAARHPKTNTVIKYAVQHGSALREIEKLYPITDPQLDDEQEQGEPSIFGVEHKAHKRFFYNLFRDNAEKTRAFEQAWDEFIARVRALLEAGR